MTSNTPAAADVPSDAHVEKVGAFDIRRFIGALIGLYGIVLMFLGFFSFTAEESAKTGGFNANLWVGVGMLVAGIIFFVWAALEPIRIVVRPNEPGAEEDKDITTL